MALPGGRYACAQLLLKRGLPFSHMSLGRMCHVVQLAMTRRKLLGYLNGSMVPYAHSQCCAKEKSASLREVCLTSTALPFADWDTTRDCLQRLLHDVPDKFLSISNVKRYFRSEFHVELSETRLGHSKMTSLLMDQRLSDICSVQLHGHGHAVIQATSSQSTAWDHLFEDPLLLE